LRLSKTKLKDSIAIIKKSNSFAGEIATMVFAN